MTEQKYDLADWQYDFSFLSRYVFRSDSGFFPPDYELEIREQFEVTHPDSVEFRCNRAVAAIRFLISHLDSFKVGGLAQEPAGDAVELSKSLWFALWTVFCATDERNFDADPDPQVIVNIAEDADSNGLFPPNDDGRFDIS